MALFNYATKEITLKIVYYGPGLSGKTTNLQYIHSILNPETKGKLLSLSTEADRTLFFDFLPVELGHIRDFSLRFQLYTVPGQVRYNATRRVVLKGVDGVVFVADSQREMKEQNIDSFANMRENLLSNNINPDEIPIMFQYNKRDLKNINSVDELNAYLNQYNYPSLEASAINGVGVEDSFKLITRLLIKYISKKHKIDIPPLQEAEEPRTSPGPQVDVKAVSAAPAPEPLSSEKPDAIETGPYAVAETKKIIVKEAPVIPEDKISMLADEISKITGILVDLNKTTAIMGKQMKELKEASREHEETSRLLREIIAVLDNLKSKKSWFKF